MISIRKFCILLVFSALSLTGLAQHGHENHPQEQAGEAAHPGGQTQDHPAAAATAEHPEGEHSPCGHSLSAEHEFNAGENAIHHIADANAIHLLGNAYFHLPCILYAPSQGWTFTKTSAFDAHHHGNGTKSHEGYVLVHANIMRLQNPALHSGELPVEDYMEAEEEGADGKPRTVFYALINGQCEPLDAKSTLDGGIMGGGITSFYDFSITRNVFTMLLTVILLFLVFRAAAKASVAREGQAPKGLQNFIEPFVTFIRDEVAKPNIGPKYEKYMPFLLSVFFFILGLNLIGQIPFFPGSANVTGNLSITLTLAVLTFLITNLTANRHYWAHTLWMPGVPAVLKIIIITPIEVLGLILKPFTLMLRLFANITAGHMVILSFVSLIFIFGDAGQSLNGSIAGIAASVPLTLFMMTLELLVAFLQAFIFTMLSAVYFGAAVEEPHHH
ncbi:MAG: F0F1 ATP synthase subunit A [Saprospiraceae bacterium]|nr:F0F1 ATP synthase subunit A [Saprospiraceae bacterium]